LVDGHDLKLPVETAPRSPNLEDVQAVIIDPQGFRLDQRPDPVPAAGQVLVASEFAGLNAADLLQRRGRYPAPAGWPTDIPGMELSGTVVALGEGVDPGWRGARVCALVGAGAQATRCLVPAAHLIRVPDAVTMDQAGGFAEAFVTAFDALVLQGRLVAGERVLVSGASGGVGTAALQIGRLLGAHVTAVTRHHSHRDTLTALGADDVIDLTDVEHLAPVDVVLELVGAAHLALAQRRLAPFARVVVIGVSGGGAVAEVDLLNVMNTRATVTGSTMRSRSHDEKAEVVTATARALSGPWARGEIRVPLATTFALDEFADAYEYFARPGKLGKVLLEMPDAR
jgi:NADPH:quinone reductase